MIPAIKKYNVKTGLWNKENIPNTKRLITALHLNILRLLRIMNWLLYNESSIEIINPETNIRDRDKRIRKIVISPGVIRLLPQTSANTDFWMITSIKKIQILFIYNNNSEDTGKILN